MIRRARQSYWPDLVCVLTAYALSFAILAPILGSHPMSEWLAQGSAQSRTPTAAGIWEFCVALNRCSITPGCGLSGKFYCASEELLRRLACASMIGSARTKSRIDRRTVHRPGPCRSVGTARRTHVSMTANRTHASSRPGWPVRQAKDRMPILAMRLSSVETSMTPRSTDKGMPRYRDRFAVQI